MVDVGLVTAKLAEIADRISRVRLHAKASADEMRASRDAFELVSFNLMLAVQACADVAQHVVMDEGWAPARSLRDGFERLRDQGVLSAETTQALSAAVGLRNVVAHGYAGVDADRVHDAAHRGVRDLERFVAEVAAWLTTRRSP